MCMIRNKKQRSYVVVYKICEFYFIMTQFVQQDRLCITYCIYLPYQQCVWHNDVYLQDGKGNRVKQWSRALTTKGVFSGELQLPQSPVLGDWNITVVVMDQFFYKTFQVAEYVLPKFEVTIDAPAHATFKDSHIVATVNAK